MGAVSKTLKPGDRVLVVRAARGLPRGVHVAGKRVYVRSDRDLPEAMKRRVGGALRTVAVSDRRERARIQRFIELALEVGLVTAQRLLAHKVRYAAQEAARSSR